MDLDLVLNLAISFIVATSVAAFFRFCVRPKTDIVFDENQQIMLKKLFAIIEEFDKEFGACYSFVERCCGPLTPDKEYLFRRKQPSIRAIDGSTTSTSYVKAVLEKRRVNMEYSYDVIIRYNQRAGIYISEILLDSIVNYCMATIEWAISASHGRNLEYALFGRHKHAHEIIAFLEQRSLNNREFGTVSFVQKWQEYDSLEKH